MSVTEVVPNWFMRGEMVASCNCDWGCPCNFQAAPTYGFCDGFYTIVVEEGRYGDVVLDGSVFVWGGHAPSSIHEGEGTSVLVFDRSMTPDQRAAVERLWRGGGTGSPFDEFASVTEIWYDPMEASIDVHLDGIHSSVTVTGAVTYALELDRIRNPVTGEEEITFLDHPTGFTSTYAELGMSRTAVFESAVASFDTSGKYAEHAKIHYQGP